MTVAEKHLIFCAPCFVRGAKVRVARRLAARGLGRLFDDGDARDKARWWFEVEPTAIRDEPNEAGK